MTRTRGPFLWRGVFLGTLVLHLSAVVGYWWSDEEDAGDGLVDEPSRYTQSHCEMQIVAPDGREIYCGTVERFEHLIYDAKHCF